MLSLLVFIGEAVRDAFDPRKTFAVSTAPDTLLEIENLAVRHLPPGRALVTVDAVRGVWI